MKDGVDWKGYKGYKGYKDTMIRMTSLGYLESCLFVSLELVDASASTAQALERARKKACIVQRSAK